MKYIVSLVLFIIISCKGVITENEVYEVIIENENKIYLKYYASTNSSYVILAEDKKKHLKIDDYEGLIYSDEAIFFEIREGKLRIYHRCRVKKRGNSSFPYVVNKEISNSEFYHLWENYSEKGVFKFPN